MQVKKEKNKLLNINNIFFFFAKNIHKIELKLVRKQMLQKYYKRFIFVLQNLVIY